MAQEQFDPTVEPEKEPKADLFGDFQNQANSINSQLIDLDRAVTADPEFGDEAREAIAAKSKPNMLSLILAGLGDAVSAGGGRQTSFTRDIVNDGAEQRRADLSAFDKDKQANIKEKVRANVERRKALLDERDKLFAASENDKNRDARAEEFEQQLKVQNLERMEKQKEQALKIQTEMASDLRKEWESNKLTINTRQISQAYERIQASAKQITEDDFGAGDLALIFNYMKMLDPGSAVREGEFANAENSGGISRKVANLYNKLRTGKRLDPAVRQDFLNRSHALMNAQLKTQEKFNQRMLKLAAKSDVEGEDVVDFTLRPGQDPREVDAVEKPEKKKQVKRKAYNPTTDVTMILYSDGTTETVEGQM